jgi:hypothetical protein
MLRCGQSFVLVTTSMTLLDQTPFSNCFQFLFLGLRCNCWFAVWCVAASSGDSETRVVFEMKADGVKAGMRRLRLKGQQVPIWHVVGDGCQVSFEAASVSEFEVLSSADLGYSFGNVLTKPIHRSFRRRLYKKQRREQNACAVQGLFCARLSWIRSFVGILRHAASGRSGFDSAGRMDHVGSSILFDFILRARKRQCCRWRYLCR